MSPAAEVALVVQREIRKNVRSAKGLILLGLSLLGGVIVALAFNFVATTEREFIAKQLATLPPEAIADATEKVHREIVLRLGGSDEALGDALSKAPLALWGSFKGTVLCGPWLVALLGFDAVSGELQHRTVRFWTVRTRRVSYYVGKVLGLWAVVSLLTFFVHAIIWVVVIARGNTAGSVLEWGPRFWACTLPLSLVWCALVHLLGSQFRVPILALLMSIVGYFLFVIAWGLGINGKVPPLEFVYPNTYETWLIHPHLDRVFEGLGICLGCAVAYIAAGAAVFARRDV